MAIDCEPCDDDGEGEDAEPSLGSFDRMTDQEKSWRKCERDTDIYGWSDGVDLEQDDCDYEDCDPNEAKQQPPEMGGASMTTTSDDVRSHVNSIERPLTGIRHFLDAIVLITEAMEEPQGGAVNVIVHAALDHVRDAEAVHQTLFRLTHPDRERFEREGWPGDDAGAAA